MIVYMHRMNRTAHARNCNHNKNNDNGIIMMAIVITMMLQITYEGAIQDFLQGRDTVQTTPAISPVLTLSLAVSGAERKSRYLPNPR